MDKKRIREDIDYYVKQVEKILSNKNGRGVSVLDIHGVQFPLNGDYDCDSIYYAHIDNLIRFLEIELDGQRKYIEEVKKLRSSEKCYMRTSTLRWYMSVHYKPVKDRIRFFKKSIINDWNPPEKQARAVDINGDTHNIESTLRKKVIFDIEDVFFEHFEKTQ